MKITDFSVYSDWTYTSKTENISSITDKLIRLAAKITEHYAGDIIYDIEALECAVEGKQDYDKILFFREDGVSTYKTEMVMKETRPILCNDYIQTWRLSHNPETTETVLHRVIIREER